MAAGEFLLENAASAEALATMILRLATAAEQVAEALRYMHEQGIVHGGLTAEKIAVCYTTQDRDAPPVYKVGSWAPGSCLSDLGLDVHSGLLPA